jgi:hypothetical protein
LIAAMKQVQPTAETAKAGPDGSLLSRTAIPSRRRLVSTQLLFAPL